MGSTNTWEGSAGPSYHYCDVYGNIIIRVVFIIIIIIIVINVLLLVVLVVPLRCLEQAVPDENVPGKHYLFSWGTLAEAMYRARASEPDNPQVARISNYIQLLST